MLGTTFGAANSIANQTNDTNVFSITHAMFRSTLRAAHSSSKLIPDYVGSSGLTYSFQKLIQRRPETGSVWMAEHVITYADSARIVRLQD